MLSLERELTEMEAWHRAVEARCYNDDFLEVAALPWFTGIGPIRAREYGVLGLNELGVLGVTAQVFNCYFRWANMERAGTALPRMTDVLRDTVGFATLTGIVAGVDPEKVEWWEWDTIDPRFWYMRLKLECWEARDEANATEWAWAVAVGMFNVTWERVHGGS